MKDKKDGGDNQAEADQVVPLDFFLQVQYGKDHENDQRNDLLNGFQLGSVEAAITDRLAGTWKQYSAKAIPQLTMIASQRGEALCFRCPYQARVILTYFSQLVPKVSRNIIIKTLANIC